MKVNWSPLVLLVQSVLFFSTILLLSKKRHQERVVLSECIQTCLLYTPAFQHRVLRLTLLTKGCGLLSSQGREHQCFGPDASFLSTCVSVCCFLCNQPSLWTGVQGFGRKKATALPNECFLLHVQVHSRAAGQGLNYSHSHVSDAGSLSSLTWSKRHFPPPFVSEYLWKSVPCGESLPKGSIGIFFFCISS